MIKRRTAIGGLVALAAAGCSRSPAPSAASRPRVVSLSPSTTEAVFAIGAGDLLVGRSKYCDYPSAALSLPVVGGFADPSIEAIVALKPTLAVGARGPAGPALESTLQAHGIATYFPETESIAQIEAMLEGLGRKLDRETGARSVINSIEMERREVEGGIAARNLRRVRAAFLFDVEPIFVAGPGSFADELMRMAGGDNVITTGGQYPTLDLERLLALDPEVILDGSMSSEAGPSRVLQKADAPGWKTLRAVREGRVRPLAAGAVLRPGPRIGRGLAAIAQALHGVPF